MARSHAKVLVQVWRDKDWCDLSMPAQWLYVLILSQPKLTLVGTLEVTTGRWAHLCAGVSREAVEDALSELRAASKVIVDDHTDELLIRTFTTHDIDPNRVNVNLAKGLWGQWSCIASDHLRRMAVLFMPDAVWDKLEPHAPSDAAEIRRSARLEPDDRPRSQPQPPPRYEPPPSSHLPTDTSHRPGAPSADSQPGDKPLSALAAKALTAPQRLTSRHLEIAEDKSA